MGRLGEHDEVAELLGAYALDSVEGGEVLRIETHLLSCPRCRDELRGHREVVGLLSYSGHSAPPGLWDKVAGEIAGAGAPGAHDLSLGGRGRPAGPRRRALAAVAAAALVVVGALGTQVVRLQQRTDRLGHQVAAMAGEPTMAAVQAALSTPGSRRVALRSPGGPVLLDAVIRPGGAGYLYDPQLDPLPAGETYQLWGISGTRKISYGLIGSVPPPVSSFRTSPGVQAIAVTVEVAGGVPVTTHAPVAVGSVG